MSEAAQRRKALVGVVTDCADVDGAAMNSARVRYLEALSVTADVLPVLLPTTLACADVQSLVETYLDGIVLTGVGV
jgi:putative glutamine amidotransferase